MPALLALVCCSDRFADPEFSSSEMLSDVPHEMIVLGEQLEDPYSVVNITKAVESLYPTKAGSIQVEPTDYYVRFLPSDQYQFDKLMSLGIDLLDHPMDYRIVREGDYYIDPEVEEGSITWQYSVVRKDFVFPKDIRCEILDVCYIADHDTGTKADGIDWNAVEAEAYRITGNGDMLGTGTRAGSSGTPEGRITILDDKYDSEPVGVAGVKVSCNSFVKIATAFTDESGYYSMKKSFSTDVRYRLVFKNTKGFGIGLNLLLVPASVSTLGKWKPSGFSCSINADSDKWLFARCAVNNAVYDYCESCSSAGERMKTPPTNLRIWLFQNLGASAPLMLQQGCMVDGTVVGEFLGDYASLVKTFLPDVVLGLQGVMKNYSTIYSETIHQMAHASHFVQVGKKYWNSYLRLVLTSSASSGRISYGSGVEDESGYVEVCEMWAYYLETVLYRDRYADSSVTFGIGNWFYPQIFLYLDDRAIGRYKLFSALTDDVHDGQTLKERLLSLYPEEKNVINQAFLRYI